MYFFKNNTFLMNPKYTIFKFVRAKIVNLYYIIITLCKKDVKFQSIITNYKNLDNYSMH